MMMVVLMMVMGRSFDELTLDRSWSMLRLMMMMKPSWSWSWLSGLMTDMDDEFLLVLLLLLLPPPSSPPPPQQQPCPRRSSCFTPLRLLVGGFCLRHPAASPLSRAPPPPCGRDTASASCAPPSSPTVPPLLALALEATPRQTQPTTDCPRTGGLFSSNTSKMSSQSLWSSS